MTTQENSISPQLIGHRYALKESLGSGGMGVVYRAEDRFVGRDVALKFVTVKPEQLKFNSRAPGVDMRVPLAKEFRMLASLRHPNIIEVLDYGFDAHRQPYFTMNLLEDAQSIDVVGFKLDIKSRVHLIVQALQALSYLHHRSIIHRDLKPSNLLVRPDGKLYVLDFGLAMEHDQTPELAGTLLYIAPELLQGQPVTPASDLYSLGIIAYELFVGTHPFQYEDTRQFILDTVQKAPNLELVPDSELETLGDSLIPLSAIINKLLAKDPNDRYHNADHVIFDLCAAVNEPVPEESQDIRESFLQAAAFIGRDEELQQLVTSLDYTLQGKGSAWLISGESGVGKSRLVDELRTLALVRGVKVLYGQGVAEGALPYQLWRNPLRRLVLDSPILDVEASILAEVIPDIYTLIQRTVPPIQRLPGQEGQRRLCNTISGILIRQKQPILLILEDLQWVNESLSALKMLFGSIHEHPLMILATYRSDEAPDLSTRLGIGRTMPGVRSMRLERLSEQAVADLSAAILGQPGQQAEVIDLLQRETEGNVLFIIEVLRALAQDAGRLNDIGSRTLPESIFAGGIQQIIQKRLQQIPADSMQVLKLAAVIGRQIDMNLLQSVIDERPMLFMPSAELGSWLAICANAAVLTFTHGFWRFSHDKLREAVLGQLSAEEKSRLHHQIARAIERTYSDHLEIYTNALAHHWAVGGDERKESYYALIAARQAEHLSKFRDAKRLYQRVLGLKYYEEEEVPLKREAEIQHCLGRVCYQLSEYVEARSWQEKALLNYRVLEDMAGIADAVGAMGKIDLRQGRYHTGKFLLEESLLRYSELSNRKKVAYALIDLGVIAQEEGNLLEAMDLLVACYEIMIDIGEPIDMALVMNHLGNVYELMGSRMKAVSLLQDSLKIYREVNDRHGMAEVLNDLAAIEMLEGHYDSARQMQQEALRYLRGIGDKFTIAAVLDGLSHTALQLENYHDALFHQRESLEIAHEIGSMSEVARALQGMGDIAAKTEDFETAKQHYYDALKITHEIELVSVTLKTLEKLAHVLAIQQNPRKALELLTLVRRYYVDMEHTTHEIDDVIARLQGSFTPQMREAIQTQGETLRLEDVVNALITEEL